MAPAVFPDNTVLCNFAAVGRIDLLVSWFRGRGRWTEAVAHEARRSVSFLPGLTPLLVGSWLGEPIEVNDPDEVARIERIRRVVFGGPVDVPTKHLGEAQTCFLLRERAEFRDAWWITDDEDAYEYSHGRGIVTYRTTDIMQRLVADGDLTASAAFDLMQSMAEQGRVLRLPARPADLE